MPRKLTLGTLLPLLLLMACGNNQPITVSPSSADAKNFPNGIVQFTATGVSSPPRE